MSKIYNNSIFLLGILTLIFGLFFASPVFARGGIVESGLNFTPYTYPVQYAFSNTTPTVIPGCEGRNTGFSTTTGQSCVGNYVNNTNTNNNSSSTNTTTNTSTTTKNSNTNTTNTDNTVSKTTNTNEVVAYNNDESDINEGYGGLTANALFGSNSFLPTGLAQWIILIIIILAIIFLWRYVHGEEKYLSEPLKHA